MITMGPRPNKAAPSWVRTPQAVLSGAVWDLATPDFNSVILSGVALFLVGVGVQTLLPTTQNRGGLSHGFEGQGRDTLPPGYKVCHPACVLIICEACQHRLSAQVAPHINFAKAS